MSSTGILSNDVAPLVVAASQQRDSASAAPTPHRNRVTDYFKTVTASEHINIQNELMQPDELDLRNVFKSGDGMCFEHSTMLY
jgi:hypothetical protein